MKVRHLLLMLMLGAGSCQANQALLLAKITLDDATRQILKDSKKRVLGATTEIINGREVHVIKVLTPEGRIQHYKIDAETGARLT